MYNKRQKQTTLSNHVWDLKDNNIPHEIKWKILAKAKTFNPVTNKCRLCLKEMYYICYKPETVYGDSKHREGWTLSKS